MTQSRFSSQSSSDLITDLAAAFHQLDIARERLARAVAAFESSPSPSPSPPSAPPPRRIASTSASRHRRASPSPDRNPPLLPTSEFRLGDRVQIRYPNPGQQITGVVVGSTRGGFLYVRTPNGDILRRMPHNLRPL